MAHLALLRAGVTAALEDALPADLAEEVASRCSYTCRGRCLLCGARFEREQPLSGPHWGDAFCSPACSAGHSSLRSSSDVSGSVPFHTIPGPPLDVWSSAERARPVSLAEAMGRARGGRPVAVPEAARRRPLPRRARPRGR